MIQAVTPELCIFESEVLNQFIEKKLFLIAGFVGCDYV